MLKKCSSRPVVGAAGTWRGLVGTACEGPPMAGLQGSLPGLVSLLGCTTCAGFCIRQQASQVGGLSVQHWGWCHQANAAGWMRSHSGGWILRRGGCLVVPSCSGAEEPTQLCEGCNLEQCQSCCCTVTGNSSPCTLSLRPDVLSCYFLHWKCRKCNIVMYFTADMDLAQYQNLF